MDCIFDGCEKDALTDYVMCATHAPLRHFTNRADCQCEDCAAPVSLEYGYTLAVSALMEVA